MFLDGLHKDEYTVQVLESRVTFDGLQYSDYGSLENGEDTAKTQRNSGAFEEAMVTRDRPLLVR